MVGVVLGERRRHERLGIGGSGVQVAERSRSWNLSASTQSLPCASTSLEEDRMPRHTRWREQRHGARGVVALGQGAVDACLHLYYENDLPLPPPIEERALIPDPVHMKHTKRSTRVCMIANRPLLSVHNLPISSKFPAPPPSEIRITHRA